jgi:hypothetical protein
MIKNMIFRTTFFLCLGGLSISLNAQSDKTIVGILPFTFTSGAANPQDVNSIQESVANAFVTAKRFNIVDRSKMDALKNEKELQKTEDFIDGTVISQSASLGAQYLISGHVISATANEFTVQDPNTGQTSSGGFKAKLSISLKVIDVATGQVTTAETIEPKGGSMLGQLAGVAPSSAEAAIAKAIKDIGNKIDEFVSINFPVTFQIAEIQEKDNSGNAKTLLLAGGSGFGLKKGDKMKVVELMEMEVGGKKMIRKKEIGELQITKVEDENFSVCSVKSGGADINTKFGAKGNLQVISL